MSSISGFGSGSGMSAWQSLQNWRASQSSARADLDAATTAITDALSSADANIVNGQSQLAAQQALARIQAEAKAKQAAQPADNTDNAAADTASGSGSVTNDMMSQMDSEAAAALTDKYPALASDPATAVKALESNTAASTSSEDMISSFDS